MSVAVEAARVAVQALCLAGVDHVVVCPGSRSAPLVYALAEAAETGHGPAVHVRHDERVAAFTALGIGLAEGSLGAVVTTSGTAVANLHPAVLEAHHALRPLVAVTADRPIALRGTWANQTTALQAGLFGDAVRARLDLADADVVADRPAALLQLVEAVAAARAGDVSGRALGVRRTPGPPGPVHLDLGYAEPLVPDAGRIAALRPHLLVRPGEPPAGEHLELPDAVPTVVLAGDGAGPAARSFAEGAGLPLLAEPSSGARGGPNAVGPYRLLLARPELGGAVRRVVAFGRPTLSRPVTRLLARPDVEVVLVGGWPGMPGPAREVRRVGRVSVPTGDPRWLAAWCAAGAAVGRGIDAVLDADAAAGRLSGPLVAREVWAALGDGEHLVAAASNPIRDLDLAAVPGPGIPHVVANRGLAGIDGTLSTATGLALAGGPVRVLVGDVAFLHDLNALLAGPGERRPDVQVVVLNDGGGGIFSLLEYGERAEHDRVEAALVERFFGTPHAADLASLAAGYGIPHRRVRDLEQLRTALREPPSGPSVLEVAAERTGTHGLRALHDRLRATGG